MSKKQLKHLFLLFLSAGILYACLDEISSLRTDRLSPEVAAAKAWFELTTGGKYLSFQAGERESLLEPDWRKAFSNADSAFRVTEVGLKGENRFLRVTYEASERFRETGDKRYLASDMRLVVRTCKETGERFGFIMVVYPDLNYLEKNLNNPLRNFTYLKRDPDFSGTVYFYDLGSEFINGWLSRNGVYMSFFPSSMLEPQLRSNDEICYEWCEMWQPIILVTIDGETTWMDFGKPFAGHCFIMCYPGIGGGGVEPPPGTGGGGGGGSPGGDGNTSLGSVQNRSDCLPKAAANGTTINNVLNSNNPVAQGVSEMIGRLRNLSSSSLVEHGLAVQRQSHPLFGDEFHVLHQNQGAGNSPFINSGGIDYVEIGRNEHTYLLAHTHPNGTNAAPSPLDAIVLGSAFRGGSSNITANVIFAADGSEYMVFVNDRTAFAAFSNNPVNSLFFQNDGAMFRNNSIWANRYESVHLHLLNSGFSQNDAQKFALAYVLDSSNTGLKIYEKRNGSFKELLTELLNGNYIPKRCP
jgi:hypothetical protein